MECGIAFGSNTGDRLAELRHALMELAARCSILAVSPAYRTAPVDCPDGSGAFLNAVVEIEWSGTPLALLHLLRGIEAAAGRPDRRPRNAPRPIDLDILYAGDTVSTAEELTLPHPRLHLRRFVLQPLADIHPGLILPGQARTVRELLHDLVTDEPPLRLFHRSWGALAAAHHPGRNA